MNYSKPKNKGKVSEDTIARECQMNNIYKEMYKLPDFNGSQNQINYAVSLRLKLIDNFQKDENTPNELKVDLFNRVFKIDDAKLFLDEFAKYGKFLWSQYKSNFCNQMKLAIEDTQHIKLGDKTPIQLKTNETWLISVYDENKITLRTVDSSMDKMLTENGMVKVSEYFWELITNINAVDRKTKENKLKDLLLDNEKLVKLEKKDPKPKPVYHDAVISKQNDRIIVNCHTMGSLRSFLGIGGCISIDITDCKPTEIKKLFSTNNDIGFSDEKIKEMFQ